MRFADSDGFMWDVAEVATSSRRRAGRGSDAGALPDRTLYFLSLFATRRLIAYPQDWRRLRGSEVARLCALAEPLEGEAEIPLARAGQG